MDDAPVHFPHDVAFLDARLCRRAVVLHTADERTIPGCLQVTARNSQTLRSGSSSRLVMADGSSSTSTSTVRVRPSRWTIARAREPGSVAETRASRSSALATAAPAKSTMTSPHCRPAVSAVESMSTDVINAPPARGSPSAVASSSVMRSWRKRHANVAADNLARTELREQRLDVVDRDGESDAASRADLVGDHCRVDPDDLAAHVEERAARAARGSWMHPFGSTSAAGLRRPRTPVPDARRRRRSRCDRAGTDCRWP